MYDTVRGGWGTVNTQQFKLKIKAKISACLVLKSIWNQQTQSNSDMGRICILTSFRPQCELIQL